MLKIIGHAIFSNSCVVPQDKEVFISREISEKEIVIGVFNSVSRVCAMNYEPVEIPFILYDQPEDPRRTIKVTNEDKLIERP